MSEPVIDYVAMTVGVIGKVQITWLGDGSAAVSGRALTFQGATWDVDAAYRKASGGWWEYDSDHGVKQPVVSAGDGRGAPPVVAAAMLGALTVALDSAWTPERAAL